jgi:hypothetical protein
MAILSSKLAPGFIRMAYEGTRNPHHQIIKVKFSGTPVPGEDPLLETKGGGTKLFSVAIAEWQAVGWGANMATGVRAGASDIYAVSPTTGVRTFIYTVGSIVEGDNVNPTIPFTEAVWVFKTTVGKPLKVYLMESVYDADQRNVGSVPADARQEIVDYILDDDNIFYGQTDAWPLAFQTFTTKINDVLRRNGGFTDV